MRAVSRLTSAHSPIPRRADRIARAFALIAAVDQEVVQSRDGPVTRLHLSWLKPGATRDDVIGLAQRLGLEEVAFGS